MSAHGVLGLWDLGSRIRQPCSCVTDTAQRWRVIDNIVRSMALPSAPSYSIRQNTRAAFRREKTTTTLTGNFGSAQPTRDLHRTNLQRIIIHFVMIVSRGRVAVAGGSEEIVYEIHGVCVRR